MFRGKFGRHAFAALATIILTVAISNERAAAQVTYSYTGNPFTLFSCGPNQDDTATMDCTTPAPTNQDTSYTATDHVIATLILDSALGANFPFSDVSGLPGFSLSMNDGHQTVTAPAPGEGLFASVSTDGNGNIDHWELVINTGGTDNGGIFTEAFSVGSSNIISDQGTISCCDPRISGNLGMNMSVAGIWTGGSNNPPPPPSPTSSVNNLIAVISNPTLGLASGQASSLLDKLDNVLASLQAGQSKQAGNQLKAFISSVQSSVKTQKISVQTGTSLINAANAIIAAL